MTLVKGESISVPGYPNLSIEPIPGHKGFVTLHANAGPVKSGLTGELIERWAHVSATGELYSPDSGASLRVALTSEDLEAAKQFVATEGLRIAFAAAG